MKRLGWLFVLAALLAACSDLGPRDRRLERLEANLDRWDSLGPDSYVYAVERLCFCAVESLGPVRVRVEDGVAVQRIYVDTGAAVPVSYAEGFPTVEGLFDTLREAILNDADSIEVTYDPTWGVPLDFWIDYLRMVADDELGMRITEPVAPLP
jgi:hypothetical protein